MDSKSDSSDYYIHYPVSLPQKWKRGPFTLSEKKIVVDLYNYLEKISPSDHNRTSIHEKTAKILGISTPYVFKILNDNSTNKLPSLITMKKKPPYNGILSEWQMNEIRKKVYTFYVNREAPSMKTIFTAVNRDENLPFFKWNRFEHVLRCLKLKPLRRVGTDSVLDYGRVVIHRREYLEKVKKCREQGRPIYYLDELWVNTVRLSKNIGQQDRRTDNRLDFWTPKANLQNWLKEKGIPYREDEFRVEMVAKVNRVQRDYRVYAVDEIARKYNVEVLRLPPFHIELNPIEEVWDDVRGKVSGNAYANLEDLKKLVLYAVENVPSEKWQQSVQRVKEKEGWYYDLDDIIDDVTDEFLENTEGFDDEPDDTETDSD